MAEDVPISESKPELWADGHWVVTVGDDELIGRRFPMEPDARGAAIRIKDGESVTKALGWERSRIPLKSVRAVEWVPAAGVLLVWRGWWRDPWRIDFPDTDLGEGLYHRLCELVAPGRLPTEERVGPNDLSLDPKFGIAILAAFLGVVGLILGAVETMPGRAGDFAFVADIGRSIGAPAAFAIGGVGLLAGVGALVWWYRNRPMKFVVRPERSQE